MSESGNQRSYSFEEISGLKKALTANAKDLETATMLAYLAAFEPATGEAKS